MATDNSQTVSKKAKKFNLAADSLVRLEITRKNDKVFDNKLGRVDILSLWSSLRLKSSDLDGFARVQIPGRALRINFRLKKPVVLSDFFKKPDFDWEKSNTAGDTDFY